MVYWISAFKVWYSWMASYSSLASSTAEASKSSFNWVNLLMTLVKASWEKVEATCNKEAMGLEFPILANSAKAKLSSLVLGSIVPNFSLIKSKAAATSMAYCCLLANSSASAYLLVSNSVSLSFKMDNWEDLTLISAVN